MVVNLKLSLVTFKWIKLEEELKQREKKGEKKVFLMSYLFVTILKGDISRKDDIFRFDEIEIIIWQLFKEFIE